MSQQCPPGCRFPETNSVSPQRQRANATRTGDHRGSHRLSETNWQGDGSSWWNSFEGAWTSFMGTEATNEELQQRQAERRAENQQQQHLQRKTHYGNRQRMDGIVREEVQHRESMAPPVGDNSAAPHARSRPRAQRRKAPAKDGFYVEKPRKLSPLRNRSPIPNRSPVRQTNRSPVRAPGSPHSPVPPPPPPEKPSSETGLWYFLYGTEKRRLNFWTVVSILMLGPPIFLGGFYAGHGLESNPQVWVTGPNDGGDGDNDNFRPTFPPYVYETNIFMNQDDILKEDERLFLTSTNQGAHLKQESNGNLVLYNRDNTVLWHSGVIRAPVQAKTYSTILQGDGNLVTHSTTYDAVQRMWATEVEWSSGSESLHHGEYTLLLTPKNDGLMIIRNMDGELMWSTVPVELEAAPTESPTGTAPTRSPVDYPTPKPTLYPTVNPTLRPTNFPTVAPSPRPTMVGWPITVAQSQVYALQSGPMIGHTTHNSCNFWVYLGRPVPMQLVYWAYGDTLESSRTVTLTPDAESNGAAMETIQGLQANTMYLYEVRISNEWISQGFFKTAPPPRLSTSFKYLLTSCMNVKSNDGGYRNQPVWDSVSEKDVDFAMLAGDNVYFDHRDWTYEGEMIYDRVWARFMEQRAEPHFARLLKSVPTYGSWDDHDFGRNNAEHRQPGKENTLQAWGHLWGNPYQGSAKGPGNYYHYSWGDADFIVLDCRWYRNSFNGTLFGDPQLEWLEDVLVSSTATFKIIVSASDVMEKGMTRDLKTIGAIVARNSISGVLFNSGDIHRNEYKVQDHDNWPYRVHQLTSSGIARVWRRNYAIINVNTNLVDPEIKAEFYAADSTQRYTTWSNDPNLICGDYDERDEERQAKCTQRIRLSDLTPRF